MSKLIDISKFNLKEDTKSFYSDDLEIEIGDVKDSTMFRNRLKFKPTFEKPNEANFSLGLDHDSCGNDFQKMSCNIEVGDNIISFIYDFLRIDLYIVNDLRFEKPSPEYEVTLLSQPKGYTSGEYKLYFSLQTKKLDFFRQPSFKSQSEDLIKEFGKEISISDTQVTDLKGNILAGQPTWNVDSIACYTPFKNNKYKTGKSHHFPRPEMQDKNGFVIINYMEIAKDEIIITISDGVLQSGNYPFRHVTGATLGYTGVGVSISSLNTYGYGQVYTATENGTATAISMYLYHNNASTNIKFCLYTGSSPFNLVTWGELTGLPPRTQWEVLTLGSPPSITSGTNYLIYGRAEVTTDIYYDTIVTQTTYYNLSGSPPYGSVPADPQTMSTTTARHYSMYITYTPSGGTPTFIPRIMII